MNLMSTFVRSGQDIVFAVKRFRLRFLFILSVGLLGFSLSTLAQDASIVGTVTDPSGASVPNVKITVTNTETGSTHTVVSNDSGQYAIPELKIGHYDAKAEATGFKAAEQKGLLLQVGDRTRDHRDCSCDGDRLT